MGLLTFLRDNSDCGVTMLRRLLLCNFTPTDKQIQIYNLERQGAIKQEIGSFSLRKRVNSVSLHRLVNLLNLSGWPGNMGD